MYDGKYDTGVFLYGSRRNYFLYIRSNSIYFPRRVYYRNPRRVYVVGSGCCIGNISRFCLAIYNYGDGVKRRQFYGYIKSGSS